MSIGPYQNAFCPIVAGSAIGTPSSVEVPGTIVEAPGSTSLMSSSVAAAKPVLRTSIV